MICCHCDETERMFRIGQSYNVLGDYEKAIEAYDMCKDYQAAIGFLTVITDAPDFEQLGENVFDAYSRIFAICQETQQTQNYDVYSPPRQNYNIFRRSTIVK